MVKHPAPFLLLFIKNLFIVAQRKQGLQPPFQKGQIIIHVGSDFGIFRGKRRRNMQDTVIVQKQKMQVITDRTPQQREQQTVHH